MMTPEKFIQGKASEAIQALYGAAVPSETLQVAVTRKEFEGDYTLVTFPLLKSPTAPPTLRVMPSDSGSWTMSPRALPITP